MSLANAMLGGHVDGEMVDIVDLLCSTSIKKRGN